MFSSVTTISRCANAGNVIGDLMTICPGVDKYSTPSYLHRAGIDGVSRHLSACLTLGHVLSRTIPSSEPCHPTTQAQLVDLRP